MRKIGVAGLILIALNGCASIDRYNSYQSSINQGEQKFDLATVTYLSSLNAENFPSENFSVAVYESENISLRLAEHSTSIEVEDDDEQTNIEQEEFDLSEP